MDYISAFANLKTNNKYARKSPHKAILLLTVIEMFEKGVISKNEIRYDETLIATFQKVWNRVLPSEATFYATVHFPFWYLHSEGFWHIVPYRNREDSFKNIWDNKIKPTESKVKEIVQYAELDEDLYFLMTMPSGRSSLKRALLETYSSLSEKDIDHLSESKDIIVDNSIAAMEKFRETLTDGGSVASSSNLCSNDEIVVNAFAELCEDVQIVLSIEYYKFLKSHRLEREPFKELFPSTAELYYHIKYKPYKNTQVDVSLQSVLTNFLYDLRIALMSEDKAMSIIDSINEAIHVLQDSSKVVTNVSKSNEGSTENQPTESDVATKSKFDECRPESTLVYHCFANEETGKTAEDRIAKIRQELETFDKLEENVKKRQLADISRDNNIVDNKRFKYLQEQFSTGGSRRGISWSREEEEYITLCFKKGDSPIIIADKIGRTENAIMTRLVMLGLVDDYYYEDNSTSSQAPIKTNANWSSDSIPAGYTIANLDSDCVILNEKGERVFSDSGCLAIINGKIYRFKVQKVCLTMKAIVLRNDQWRKSSKLLVAYNTSTLYRILSHSDFENDIEDIVEGDTIYHNKIKVRGHWFDYNGDII